jgi:hypothetical protein
MFEGKRERERRRSCMLELHVAGSEEEEEEEAEGGQRRREGILIFSKIKNYSH